MNSLVPPIRGQVDQDLLDVQRVEFKEAPKNISLLIMAEFERSCESINIVICGRPNHPDALSAANYLVRLLVRLSNLTN